MLGKLLRPVTQAVAQRGKRFAHHHSNFKYATMDEAPSPQGPWKENYDKLQKKYNYPLVAGVIILAGTITAILKFELIFFNYGPPKRPAVE